MLVRDLLVATFVSLGACQALAQSAELPRFDIDTFCATTWPPNLLRSCMEKQQKYYNDARISGWSLLSAEERIFCTNRAEPIKYGYEKLYECTVLTAVSNMERAKAARENANVPKFKY